MKNTQNAHNAHTKRFLALEWLLSDDMRMATIGARFWDKVDRESEDGCWNWTASLTTAGYGRFKVKSYHSVSAHRVAYTLANHENPADKLVLHSCDNRKCVNPSHLRPGTAKDNSQDMVTRGRQVLQDQKGSKNGNAKLNEKDVDAIRGMIAEGMNNMLIAEQYNVTHQMVSKIRTGKAWSDYVSPPRAGL